MEDLQDDLFEALANEQRRRLLFELSNGAQSLNVDSPPDGVEDSRTAVIKRHHVHLPRLEASGYIEWNRVTNTVEAGPRFDAIEPLLQLLTDHREKLPATTA